jgi:hypothetical protein
MMGFIGTMTSMTPSSVSPVLVTEIVFGLESTFPHTLAVADFKVSITNPNDANYIKYLGVYKVDDAAKTFTAKFGGAISGEYYVTLDHAQFGLIDTSSLLLKVESNLVTI